MRATIDRLVPGSRRLTGTIARRRASRTEGSAGELDFALPPELHAAEPPEARGLTRDGVRLMVSHRSDSRISHMTFREFPTLLDPGDVLVINTSATLNAAVNAMREDGTPLELHLSTALPGGLWTVEVRQPLERATQPFLHARAGERLRLPDDGTVTLHAPYRASHGDGSPRGVVAPGMPRDAEPRAGASGVRLWIATLDLPCAPEDYLARHGFPIRYAYVAQQWPLRYYQTVYATHPGSAEMPSAGRAFTPTLITQLVARGVHVVPLVLHAGVASLEEHEPPLEEFYSVPAATARAVNSAHAAGSRVIAVGTTVVRALETVTDDFGITHPGEGWTHLLVTAERGVRTVDGLLTGLHEPRASHLAMLAALVEHEYLRTAYDEAMREGYLWHEFGDLHLILP